MTSLDELFAAAPPHADAPVARGGTDELRRDAFVAALASQIRHAPEDGFVMALTGEWGSGKTSLLNLVEDQLPDEKVVRFNPWLISGTEQLVEQFFGELGGQLEAKDERFKEVGRLLKEYGARLKPFQVLPFAGAWIGRAATAAEATSKMIEAAFPAGDSLESRRRGIREALDEQGTRIVVMIDDIDRLEDDEIRQVMRLVRLVGDFPHIVYLLAFDSERVVRVLGGGDPDEGRRFLQKIVQIQYSVPALEEAQLAALLRAEIRVKLSAARRVPDAERLDELVDRVLAPSTSTVREVRRYGNALPFALGVRGGDVDPVDLLALEAARLFLAPLHDELPAAARMLTAAQALDDEDERAALAADVEELIGAAGDERVARAWIGLLFPGVAARLEGRAPPRLPAQRVANRETLWIYLSKLLPLARISSEAVNAAADVFIAGGPLKEFLAYERRLFNQLLERLPDAVRDRGGADGLSASSERVERSLVDVLARAEEVNRTRVINDTAVWALHELIALALLPLADAEERGPAAWKLLQGVEAPRMRRWVTDGVFPSSGRRQALVDDDCGWALRRAVCADVLAMPVEERRELPGLAVLLNWVARVDDEALPELHRWLDDPDVFDQYLATVPAGTERPKLLEGLPDRDARLRLLAEAPEPPRGRARRAWSTARRLTGADA